MHRDQKAGIDWLDEENAPDADAAVAQEDTAETEKTKKELRESEARKAAILQTALDAIITMDHRGEIIEFNAAAEKIFGYSREEVLGQQMVELIIPPSLRERHHQGFARYLSTGEGILLGKRVEIFAMRADGSEFPIELAVTRIPLDGPPIFTGYIRDITERKRAEQERRRLEQHTHNVLSALLEMAETLVQLPNEAEVPEEGKDVAVNEVAHHLAELTCSVLGCRRVSISAVEPETEILRPVAVVGLSPEQEKQWWREQEQQVSSLRDSPSSELVALLRANEVVILDMTSPPYNDQPNPYGVQVAMVVPMSLGKRLIGLLSLDYAGVEHTYTSEDIALAKAVAKLAALVIERERLLQERAQAQASELALREANRRMDEFLGMASHELRTPLTTIKGNVQLASRYLKNLVSKPVQPGDLPTKIVVIETMLERAERQMKLLNRLVGDLLDVSRIQANRLEMRLATCDLVAIVQDAVEDQRQMFPARTIRLEIPPEQTIAVIADDDCIGQVVTNYLANALKYSAAEKPVEVRVQAEEKWARVSVRDEGTGLSITEQEHIWERFYRAPGVEVQSGSKVGLGLGLHISRAIIERHSGQVGVESSPGQGATFWFTVPLVNAAWE